MGKVGVATAALIVALAVLVSGCGSDTANGAPVGTIITFKPSEYDVHNGDAYAGCGYDSPVPIDITLTDEAGRLLNDTQFTLQGDDPFYLFEDYNNNLLLDADEYTPLPMTYITTTSSFGTRRVFLVVTVGGTNCTGNPKEGVNYNTAIGVYSGTSYNKMDITVTSAAPTAP